MGELLIQPSLVNSGDTRNLAERTLVRYFAQKIDFRALAIVYGVHKMSRKITLLAAGLCASGALLNLRS